MGKIEAEQPLYPGSRDIDRSASQGHYDTLYRPKREPVTRFRDRVAHFYPQISRLDEGEYNFILKTVRTAVGKTQDYSNPVIQPLGRWNENTTVWQVRVRKVDMVVVHQKFSPFQITPVPKECLYLHPGDNRMVFNDLYDLDAHLGDYMTTQIPSANSPRE